jgi:hypothetical protein
MMHFNKYAELSEMANPNLYDRSPLGVAVQENMLPEGHRDRFLVCAIGVSSLSEKADT